MYTQIARGQAVATGLAAMVDGGSQATAIARQAGLDRTAPSPRRIRAGGQRLLALTDLDDVESAWARRSRTIRRLSSWSSTTRMRLVMRSPLAVQRRSGLRGRTSSRRRARTPPRCDRHAWRRYAGQFEQAEPRPTLRLGGRVVSLLELLEDFGLVGGVDARPGIAHRERISPVAGSGFDRHLARIGEFDRIADEIEKHLGEPPLDPCLSRQCALPSRQAGAAMAGAARLPHQAAFHSELLPAPRIRSSGYGA